MSTSHRMVPSALKETVYEIFIFVTYKIRETSKIFTNIVRG